MLSSLLFQVFNFITLKLEISFLALGSNNFTEKKISILGPTYLLFPKVLTTESTVALEMLNSHQLGRTAAIRFMFTFSLKALVFGLT